MRIKTVKIKMLNGDVGKDAKNGKKFVILEIDWIVRQE